MIYIVLFSIIVIFSMKVGIILLADNNKMRVFVQFFNFIKVELKLPKLMSKMKFASEKKDLKSTPERKVSYLKMAETMGSDINTFFSKSCLKISLDLCIAHETPDKTAIAFGATNSLINSTDMRLRRHLREYESYLSIDSDFSIDSTQFKLDLLFESRIINILKFVLIFYFKKQRLKRSELYGSSNRTAYENNNG